MDGSIRGRFFKTLSDAERSIMMRTMLMYTCAEFERELAHGNPVPWPDWPSAAHGLIDGIVALMQGPVRGRPGP
jgi:hypothetical protein